jgi:hypothetical protein
MGSHFLVNWNDRFVGRFFRLRRNARNLFFLSLLSLLDLRHAKADEKCALVITHENEKSLPHSTMPAETQNYLDGLKTSGWSTHLFYDEKLRKKYGELARTDGAELSTSRGSELLRGIVQLEQKKCDQILLIGVVHGTCGSSHGWEIEGGDFPLKEMIPALKKFREKGSKIAVIDQSCYSGNAIDVLSPYADCVMATSGRYRETSYLSAQNLSSLLKVWALQKPKLSMQDLFLRYACGKYASHFPDISSLNIGQSHTQSCTTDWGRPLSQQERELIASVSKISLTDFQDQFKKMGCSVSPAVLAEVLDTLLTTNDALFLVPDETAALATIRTAIRLMQDAKAGTRHGCMDFFIN